MILIGCRSILELFLIKFQIAFGLGLVLRNFCIKEMMKFQRSCSKIIFKTPIYIYIYIYYIYIYIYIYIYMYIFAIS